MAFVQIVEFTTDDIDAVQQIDQKWLAATEGKRTARRQILTRDRNQPNRYLAIVFFDSYESAMQNSAMPETQAAAEKFMAMSDGPPAFHNLEVIDDRS